MSNNANVNAFYQSTNSSTSTLRPRNNRLISFEDSLPTNIAAVAASVNVSGTPPPLNISATSGHHQRSQGNPQTATGRNVTAHKRKASENVERRASGGLWESWSSIQGLASTFLGSDVSSNGPVRRASNALPKKTNSGRMQQDKNYGLKQSLPEWGPTSLSGSQPTSVEEHKTLLQAKKREALLLQSIEASGGKDSLGRYKRKGSNASNRSPIESNSLDNEVLVYRHKVQSHDTMAGVVIKYSCQPEVFRRANRFWPNDNIQRREFVVLPIDACSIKGRKTDGPYVTDLLRGDQATSVAKHPLSNSMTNGSADPPSPSVEAVPPAGTNADDPDYKHDCWVLLPSFNGPVEILRISKQTLGYFPPGRRKSQSSSAISTPFTDSASSTPKTSFDTLRHPPSHAAQQAQLSQQLHTSLSLNSSPIRQPSLPRYLTASSRTRSSSTVSAPNGTSQTAFISVLAGPGGVGTLRGLRSERARPGPAEDGLNKKFAQYFPDQLPSDHPDYVPASGTAGGLRPPYSTTASGSLRATPRASIDSIRSTRSNSSSMPAAIAGWVGKVASSPMRKKGDLHRSERNELGMLGEVEAMDMGDLIELSDTSDEVSRQLHDATEELTPVATPILGTSGGGSRHTGESKTDDELLNERFPVRGRVRRAYEAD